MYNIIKSALNDALTQQYSDELMSLTEEKYSFSEAFEMKMKKLVKKIDTPYYKYIGYLSAAACAVIVIGCSILLPKLTSSDVPVATTPTETEEGIVTDVVTETTPTQSEATFTTTPPVSVSEIVTEPSSSEATAAPEITSESTTTVTTPESETTVPIIVTTAESSTTTETEYTYHDENPGMGGKVDEDDEDDEDICDESVDCEDDEDDGDDDIGDDSVDVTENDDEALADDDDCCDDDYVYTPPIPTEETLGEEIETLIGVPLTDSYPYNISVYNNGKVCSYTSSLKDAEAMEKMRDKEIAETLEKAELIDGTPELGARFVKVGISDIDPHIWDGTFQAQPSSRDFSPRNEYGTMFSFENDWDEDEDVDEEDEEDFECRSCFITIYDNGVIKVKSDSSIGEYYSGAAYYKADSAAVSTIFERVEQNEAMSGMKKVGDMLSYIADSADDLQNAYLTTLTNVYDIRMWSDVENGDYLYKLLKKHKSEALTANATSGSTALLSFRFTSVKNKHTFTLTFYADSTATISTVCIKYRFNFPLDETVDLLDYLCELNGKEPAKRYATLADYLEGKNFSGLNYISESVEQEGTPGIKILSVPEEDTETMAKINKIIADALDKAEYLLVSPDNYKLDFYATVKGWSVPFRLGSDYVQIGSNIFRLPDGTTEKIHKLLDEKGEVSTEADYVEEDSEEEWDD